MYKVFFNNVLLQIADSNDALREIDDSKEIGLAEAYKEINWKKWLTSESYNSFHVVDLEGLEQFFKVMRKVEAAGGLVQNSRNELLVIYRNGKWDLPKGKIEKGESILEGAVREVAEETGVEVKVENENRKEISYHVYEHKGSFIIKPTFWFKMSPTSISSAKPQLEEGIERLEWVPIGHVLDFIGKNSFRSILELIKCFHK